jgi:hypothetical protein
MVALAEASWWRLNMKKPGESSGDRGGIYREVGPRGGQRDNFATVPDDHRMPPTTTPGAKWKPVHITPDSKR